MADVLLVEDGADMAELLEMVLVGDGHEVRVGRNGVEGLRFLDEHFPQLVISDVEMPVLDGPAMIYRMFVEDSGRENIPIILISGHPRLRAIAAAVGTPYYLAKPFDPPELREMIDRALHEASPPRPVL